VVTCPEREPRWLVVPVPEGLSTNRSSTRRASARPEAREAAAGGGGREGRGGDMRATLSRRERDEEG
jgi:hypothetical protein